MSRARTLKKQKKKADKLIDRGLGTASDAVGKVGEGVRAQVAELDIPGKVADLDLPGKVADLDLPGRLQDARRELAGRIDPGPEPKHGRRRMLWIGLFLTAAGAVAWAVLSRRPRELEPLPPMPPPAPPTPPSTQPPAGSDTTDGVGPTTSSSTTG